MTHRTQAATHAVSDLRSFGAAHRQSGYAVRTLEAPTNATCQA